MSFVGLAVFYTVLGAIVIYALCAFGVIRDPFKTDSVVLDERFYLGDKNASDKIAVVRISGVISESSITFPIYQLQTAAADKHVKAIVLRIDSPGGTVSASDELYKCIVNVRDNDGRLFPGTAAKPVSVSMGALAASGGYYIAMAGNPIVAEPTTITGSIGVFVALPNIAEFTAKHGVRLELIKDGRLKASGSFFHKLSPEERQTWQDTVDSAYDTFIGVIAKGRPNLTPDALRTQIVIDKMVARHDEKGNSIDLPGQPGIVNYTRVRADGGTFTPKQAHQFGLIDGIDDLPGAIRSAAQRNGLTHYKAVIYDRPTTLLENLTGLQIKQQTTLLDASNLSTRLTPRLWYLAPSADAGILAPVP